jgi:hypothetical protein
VGRQLQAVSPRFYMRRLRLTPVASERERFMLRLDRSTLEECAQF